MMGVEIAHCKCTAHTRTAFSFCLACTPPAHGQQSRQQTGQCLAGWLGGARAAAKRACMLSTVDPSCRASAASRTVASLIIFSQAAAACASLRSRSCWNLR